MVDVESVDFFTEPALVNDPYPYFDELRGRCPVHPVAHPGVVSVTGYAEAVEVYRDEQAFSSCNAASGPFPGLPEQPEGDDISVLIERYRGQLPMSDFLVNLDGEIHAAQRALLRKLLTPKRLKDNEERIWRLADRQIDEFIGDGVFEVGRQYSNAFSLLVIADLLGVPDADREEFRQQLGAEVPLPNVGETAQVSRNPLEFLFERFFAYIQDRRREPRQDVLTELALATYPDGSTPDLDVVVRLATFLFAAGGDTTARLIASAMRILAENPEYQDLLRGDRRRIADFVEETLRTESPTKSDFRLVRTTTTVGGVTIPAGTTVIMHPGAANRDPRQFDDPEQFRLGRGNVREHLAFGRGAHSCPGGPLARAEATISIDRFLDRMTDIRISEAAHGPTDARRYDYEQSFLLRGLTELHLTFTASS
ncbi:cytochrome P450 [Frankia sp. CNm7]|uniref:Cytochrome P450 n=1 Tax=Frankia nepalensis TaxID=1836974 RepID=A0A937RCX7_9ACTN|nr:cytochrome P450 [Frankia nepalensis]MBL7496368.1 cytochrome P450 [Frankia nepalensis]MBL7508435.1 cytochrome P450 [Frankia nepalensis]MBL7520253.1 cytochrome P450 [Frankia nepalensis]MBL7627567.1 cytochrome P450 [Frankia nepalensis]